MVNTGIGLRTYDGELEAEKDGEWTASLLPLSTIYLIAPHSFRTSFENFSGDRVKRLHQRRKKARSRVEESSRNRNLHFPIDPNVFGPRARW